MVYVKWTFRVVVLVLVAAFLHYTLPQRDIVRIVGTENRRVDFGENSWFWAAPDAGNATTSERDVFIIQTVYPNGNTMEFRNEDTGWGWPPYFKLDTHSLQTEMADLVSTAEEPKWVAIKHYGWRNNFYTIFPNAVGVRAVAGPDVRLIPWTNIAILTALAALLLFAWRVWVQFRERTIDPLMDDVEVATDEARDRARGVWGRFAGWLGTWRGKPRK
ncbi:hypothetical protein ACMU_14590 [Actibacterium mucosum KCTC 23349]|uniref:DUF1523 domain-containing protein n=1 Tax=Actibacterium mucosum KCTC 23349 TaxID=1454373 RepID=A0A037ZH95_9RHOB|nr:hypothetical protein ACMU_14590 [Actibacterium mucosum KCTC 23349]